MQESGDMGRVAWRGMAWQYALARGVKYFAHARWYAALHNSRARLWRVNDTRPKRLRTKPEQTGGECGTLLFI